MLVPVSIRDVMHPSVETVPPEAGVVEAARRLRGAGIGSLVVVDDGPVGIVTEADVVQVVADEQPTSSLTVADCMSEPVITVDADAPVERAVESLREHTIKKLPVTDADGLVGIVTTTDLSYYLPHLLRGSADAPAEGERTTRDRVDTAYERDGWQFESIGRREDHIDVGDVVRFSKVLDEADVESFAEASGDTNRLHLDVEYAAGSRFGRTIAHGTLASGLISAAIARLPGLIVYLSQDTSYLGPVDIGDRVTATCEVVEDLGNDRYRLTTTVVDEDGNEVIDGEAVVLADPIPESA